MASERCHEVRLRLVRVRSGRADRVELTEVFRHLAECSGCAAEFQAETALGRRLQAETARYAAPPDLREAVEGLLRRQRLGRWAVWRARLQAPLRRPLVAAAAGALAAAMLSIPLALMVGRGAPPDPLESLMAEVANTHHLMVLQRELLDREQPHAEQVVADLQERLGLPTRAAFRGDLEVRLLAVRPTSVLGRVGVTFVYLDGSDRIITLTLLQAQEIRIPREATTQIETYRPLVTRKESVGIVTWKQAEIAYALTAAVGQEDLPGLFLKIRTAKPRDS